MEPPEGSLQKYQCDHVQHESDKMRLLLKLNAKSNENESKNATGDDTYAGALRAPRAGSPVGVFVAFRLAWVNKPGPRGYLLSQGGG